MIELNSLTPRRLLLAVLAVPMALGSLYFGLVAADRYVSESTVALQQAGADASALPGAALLLAGLNPPSREGTLYLKQYIHSLGLLQQLDSRFKLRQHYESERLDQISRLWGGASQEDFLKYYRSRVEVSIDELSSTLTVRVQGFDPKFANELNRAILEASERFVNEMSHQLAREKLRFAETEVVRAAEKLQKAKADVLAFQSKNRLLDPTVQAQASGTMVAELQASITKSEAELRALRTYLNDDSFQVQALRSQIEATRAQLDKERSRGTTSGRGGERLGALAIEFEDLKTRAEFALDAYKLALGAIENARIDATRKLKNLVVIEPATLPETAEYPRRFYNLATLLLVCLLVYGIVRLVIATIREHQD
ncbi:capsular biosynthesis protein [uncultured Piscinibacter sp.]|uniref:capsular biosynthesis protein n=1 Tax=uncultured Piscinibacter sp. TaxID=1131835 RepID=UPI00261DE781|nr:capsular biosynthesis protein [uncultured Piscinibacter sp.]